MTKAIFRPNVVCAAQECAHALSAHWLGPTEHSAGLAHPLCPPWNSLPVLILISKAPFCTTN